MRLGLPEWPAVTWPVVEFERPPELMSVAQVERFAPAIDTELADEEIEALTLETALQIPGGLAILCRRNRLRDQAAGLVGVSNSERKRDGDATQTRS